MTAIHDIIRLGKWSGEELDRLIRASSLIDDPGLRIAMISKEFLGVPYAASTLVGGCETEEAFVIDLEGMDCFTFLDYVEGMRISHAFAEFRKNVAHVRYSEGRISYEGRNHFFTDWIWENAGLVYDATGEAGGGKARRALKMLNVREDDSSLLPGIEPKEREIAYIPAGAIDQTIADRLKTGDYVGMYTTAPGLDVSHVGIFIRNDTGIYLRHASSAEDARRVIDQPFVAYTAQRPGIVVLRPKPIDG
jgi:hypothetical protein